MDYFVSPNGLAGASGTLDKPGSLRDVLGRVSSVPPGSTIFLRAGTYVMTANSYVEPATKWIPCFEVHLAGTNTSPTTIRAYPGERVIIDSGPPASIPTPGTSWVLPCAVYFFHRASGSSGHLIYRDLELQWSFAGRPPSAALNDRYRPTGFNIRKTGIKVINCIFHDLGDAYEKFSEASGGDLYGCLFYNNGWQDGQQLGTGHDTYMQNSDGMMSVTDCICCNGWGVGLHAYGANGPLKNFRFTGNVSFNKGTNSDGFSASGRATENFFIGGSGGGSPVSNVIFDSCYSYHGLQVPNGASFECDGVNAEFNEDLQIKNCVSVGGKNQVNAERYRTSVIYTGNRQYGALAVAGEQQRLMRFGKPAGNYSFSNNQYYWAPSTQAFKGSGTWLNWSQWLGYLGSGQETGSTLSQGAPIGQWIYVRKNQYEPKRAHIICYNFGLADSINVAPVGILAAGDAYVIRNAQDYFGPPVSSGVWIAGTIAIPLTALTVAQPVGATKPPPPVTKLFNVFVLQVLVSHPTYPPPVNALPVAAIASSVIGSTVLVLASGSSDQDGTIVGYAWEFGDGSTATGATASHTYSNAGNYVVRLKVTDNKGATGSMEGTVTIVAVPTPPPAPPALPSEMEVFIKKVALFTDVPVEKVRGWVQKIKRL